MNSARMSRAGSIQLVRPMTIMMLMMLGSRMAITARMRKIVGMLSMISTARMMTLSIQPP